MVHSGDYALITGASSGIGRALAHEFAGHGFNLILTAEDERLVAVGAEVREHGVDVRLIRVDLRSEAGVSQLWAEATQDEPSIAAAALNAGVGVGGGTFVDTDLQAHLDVIKLDVSSTVQLTHLVLRRMLAQNRGRLMITSSLVAAMPGAYQVTYNGSKSFLQSFAEGLQTELKDSPVTVTSLMPGPVQTDFFRRADMLDTPLGAARKVEPEVVARKAYQGLMRGRRRVIGGKLGTYAMERLNTVLPDAAKAKMQELMSKPGRSR